MKQPQQTAVFGKRAEPHTIIIARGDEIRHFTVRPWMAAVAGSVCAALAIGYLLATAYLVLRDDLIGTTVARQARMQQSYEDRISALRAQVDRITSRQLLDQQFMQQKVGELIARQARLTERQSRLVPATDRRGDANSKPDTVPIPSPRPQIKADSDQQPDPMHTASAFAPVSRSSIPWPLRNTGSNEQKLSAADRADQLFVRLNHALKSIEAEQMDSVRTLTDKTYKTAGAIAEALQEAGIEVAGPYAERDVGGPLLVSAQSEVFDDKVRELDNALTDLNALKQKVQRLPLADPAPGTQISSRFGARRDPFLGRTAHHSGIDFRARRGTEVHATGAGKVIKAGWNGGYGRMVEIQHPSGLTSRYAHMSKVLVEEGDTVVPGSVIGRVGSSGRSTGPHLHYEVRQSGNAINPARFLTAGKKISGYMKGKS